MYSNKNLVHELYQTVRFLSKTVNERLREHSLYQSQWSILYTLKRKGPMSQTDLWKYLNVEAPTITRTVRSLEKNGWVIRNKGSDKRERIVSLSEKAQNELPEVEKKIKTFEDDMLKELTASDQEQLLSLLNLVGSSSRFKDVEDSDQPE